MSDTLCDYGNHTFCIDECTCSCHEENARHGALGGNLAE